LLGNQLEERRFVQPSTREASIAMRRSTTGGSLIPSAISWIAAAIALVSIGLIIFFLLANVIGES
jgi:hypothetical protein